MKLTCNILKCEKYYQGLKRDTHKKKANPSKKYKNHKYVCIQYQSFKLYEVKSFKVKEEIDKSILIFTILSSLVFLYIGNKNYKLKFKSNLQLHKKHEICRGKVNQIYGKYEKKVENVYNTENYKILLREIKIKQLSRN